MIKLFRPLKTNLKTQGFGPENTQPRMLPIYQAMNLLAHNGWDWFAQDKEPIYWDCNIRGKVISTEVDSKGGLGVVVISEDADGIFKHIFWHLDSFTCKPGDILESGDKIGLQDNTGISTGTHLHRGLKEAKLDEYGNYKTINWSNGYKGAIPIDDYFTNIFILDHMETLKRKVEILQKQLSLWQKIVELFKKVARLKIIIL